MENDPAAAREALSGLAADRTALAGRIAAPAWTHVAFALVSALFMLGAALDSHVRTNPVPVFVVIAVFGLAWHQRRVTGVRARSVGPRAWVLVGVTCAALLLLYSVSLGLVASLSAWWVLAPAVVAFGLAWWANVAFERLTQEHVRRG